MSGHNTSLRKYTRVFICRSGRSWYQWERDTEIWRRNQTEDCYIDPSLTYVFIPYSEQYVITSLTRKTQHECPPTPSWVPTGHSLGLTLVTRCQTMTVRLAVTRWVPVNIWFQNAYTVSLLSLRMSTLVDCFRLFTQEVHPV